jgi:hypothetical protein
MHHRFARTAALALTLCAVALPTAAASSAVAPPPSSIAASTGSGYQDLRFPDTEYQDLRSPDARDAGRAAIEGRETFYVSDPADQPVAQPSPSPSDGLDWGDAGIGAASLLGFIFLGLGSTLIVMRRRQRGRRQPATTG